MTEKVAVLSEAIENQYLTESLNTSVSKHKLDEHFTLVAANPRYYEMFGYDKDEYERLFQNRPDLYYADDPEEWAELTKAVMDAITQHKKRYNYIGRMRHKSGRKIWIRLVGTLIDEYVDDVQIAYSVMMDISDMMQDKIEKDIMESNFPGLIAKYKITKKGFDFIQGNQKFHDTFDHELIFNKDCQGNNGLEAAYEQHDRLYRGESCSFTISPLDKKGNRHYLNVNAERIDWIKEEPIYLLLYTDITALTKQKKQLEEYNKSMHKLAYSDDVSGGFNRRKFEQMAGAAITSFRPGTFVLIWMNLQKFKLINETYGVEAGDHTLKYIHQQILKKLKKDESAARLFSDNFIILMKEKDKKKIEYRLQNLVEYINAFNLENDFKYYLTFTAGVYHISDNTLSITSMEDRAHAARKSQHVFTSDLCFCNFYSEEIQKKLQEEKNLENCMRESLQRHEFEVYLQPKYSLKNKRIYGAEALIRWNHPELGFLSPVEFIPIFEKNGFIVNLDLFVFEEVCMLLKERMVKKKPLFPISVNMSRAHFMKQNFLDDYIAIRKRFDIPAEYLEIELTETMVFENPEVFHSIIHIIHDAGFSCSMDDFGSGCSSLNMLKDLELDTVKLDGAFFSSENMDNQKENIIVRSIIDMTKKLDMSTVAEGIETVDQINFLNMTPCDLVQGYVISKPVPIREFEKLVAEQHSQTRSENN